MITLKNVDKNFGKVEVLKNINLSLPDGNHCTLVGGSGSGKSTLLYLLGGLDKPTNGTVLIDRENISELGDESLAEFRNKKIGFIFQFHFLLPSITCLENIELPVKIANKNIDEYKELIDMLSKFLGVEHCLSKYPYQISGGEQQRINIIRALILKPKILLCDEPTGNLDSKNTDKVISLLKELATQFRSNLIVVTHDNKVASRFEHKITIEDGRLIS